MTQDIIRITPADNVAVVLKAKAAEDTVEVDGVGTITLVDDIQINHKFALADIPQGEAVIKYGASIGRATEDIKTGQWVHSHNLGE